MRATTVTVISILASCSPEARVEKIGDRAKAELIHRLVLTAESGDAASFTKLTGRSSKMPNWLPPKASDVDRRDEGCTLKRIKADVPIVAEAFWDCPAKNYKQEVERMFLIENGRVTHMWNEWAGGLL